MLQKHLKEEIMKQCITQAGIEKTVSKETLKIMTGAAQLLMEQLLKQAAFEANSDGRKEVNLKDLDKVWPYTLLSFL
uniref:Centromere protein X n=1 Tax=Ditylenchus dipsaci TaxID=166011 RepID=A0A915DJF1_9BILA